MLQHETPTNDTMRKTAIMSSYKFVRKELEIIK